MLTITQRTRRPSTPSCIRRPSRRRQAGLRITRGVAPDGQPGLKLSVADAPESDDAVVAAENTPVFLDAEAAELLDDKVLDAQVEGGQVGFMLRDQQPGPTQ